MAQAPADDRFPNDLEFPVDWEQVTVPPEQEPSPFNDFQFTRDLGEITQENYRRNPDAQWDVVIRPPERPY